MGRNAWESDADLSKIGSNARWGRVLLWILIVAAATFGLAYYLPLHRTHRTLIEQRRQTQEAARAAEQKLRETELQLGLASKRNQELESEHRARDESQKSAASGADQLKKSLLVKLAEQKKKAHDGKAAASVAVAAESGRVLVAIATDVALMPQKYEISAAGRELVCAIAASSGTRALHVAAVSEEKP